jgi:hypothetical protein
MSEGTHETDRPEWVEKLLADLGDRTETIRAAVEEAGETHPIAAAWLDDRVTDRVTIYAACEGTIIRISGPKDPPLDHQQPDSPTECECVIHEHVIVPSAIRHASVKRTNREVPDPRKVHAPLVV